MALNRRPYLIVNSHGIEMPSQRIPIIPWQHIREVYRRFDLWGHMYLDFLLRGSEYERARFRIWRGLATQLGKQSGRSRISVIISSLDVPPEKVFAAVRRHMTRQGLD